jgi:hypothetical protein
MNKAHLLIAAALLLAPAAAVAQDKSRTVEQYSCKNVMRETGADRDVAIAFLHGFILGKSGNSRFDLDLLRKQSNDFIERCLDTPGERALDVMTKIKS